MLDEGVTIDLRSTTDGTIKRGEDSMVFDASLAPGTTKTVRKGRDGKKSTTYIQYIRDGKVFTEVVRGNSTRRQFFDRIMEVVAIIGGEDDDAC